MTAFSADDLCHHAASLRRLARDLLADDSLADDAVQQAFVAAMAAPPRSRAALPAWLRTVLRSCATDLQRSERRRQARERLAARPEALAPEDTAERIELQRDILTAVRALDEPYRSTVWLRYYEDRPPGEIAARAGVPVKTVKTRLWRALQLLRQRLDGRYGRRGWLVPLAPLARVEASPPFAAVLAAGAVLMSGKKIAVVLAVLACALLGTGLWLQLDPGSAPRPTAAAAAADGGAADAPAAGDAPAPRREQVAAPVPAAFDPGPYGALAVQVRWHDGKPAPDVAITFRADAEPQLDRNETRAVADAQGIARADRLHAGPVVLTADRGGRLETQVEAGTTRTVELVLPRGLDVGGTVVDGLLRPVAGASILLASGQDGWLGGRVVATSSADGAFQVRAVDPRWSLGARADGHGPSDLVDLEQVERAADATHVEVQLRLRSQGARVAGHVVDERGEPVAGATVFLGSGGRGHHEGLGRTREHWDGAAATSGDDGTFACPGLEPGPTPIAVRADDYALFLDQIDCKVGETTQVTVRLGRGAEVTGTVRDEAGAVVAGAEVMALSASSAAVPGDLAMRLDRDAMRRPRTRSDEDGRFRLDNVPPGELHLLAAAVRKEAMQPAGECRTTLTVRSGDRITWDPVLAAGLAIRVRLVDPDGRPVPSAVTALAEKPAPHAEQLSAVLPARDEHLTYTITGCADVPYTIAVRTHVDGQSRWICRTGVMPGGPPVVMQMPAAPAVREPATIAGRIVDAGQRLQGRSVEVKLCQPATSRQLEVAGDRFRGEKIPPGRYFVWVLAGGDQVLVGPWFELQPAQDLDIGELVTAPGADLRITLRTPAAADPGAPRAKLGDGFDSRSLRWNGRQLHAENVTAGRHRLTLWAADWHAPPRDLDLVAGTTHEITLDVVPAVPRRIEFQFPLPDRWQRCAIALRDAQGRLVSWYGEFTPAIGLEHVWLASHPLGEFLFEAVLDGDRHTWPLDLRDPATGGQRLRISMRSLR